MNHLSLHHNNVLPGIQPLPNLQVLGDAWLLGAGKVHKNGTPSWLGFFSPSQDSFSILSLIDIRSLQRSFRATSLDGIYRSFFNLGAPSSFNQVVFILSTQILHLHISTYQFLSLCVLSLVLWYSSPEPTPSLFLTRMQTPASHSRNMKTPRASALVLLCQKLQQRISSDRW